MRTILKIDTEKKGDINELSIYLEGGLVDIMEGIHGLLLHLSEETKIPYMELCKAIEMFEYDNQGDESNG